MLQMIYYTWSDDKQLITEVIHNYILDQLAN